ncbi:MAG TPA: helix-turn-helix transcriptional regulator [Acidimicrobiales bacterium]|nr:helix-turn-helix transcriptional regulator [Acidimicrobiales bacterium]
MSRTHRPVQKRARLLVETHPRVGYEMMRDRAAACWTGGDDRQDPPRKVRQQWLSLRLPGTEILLERRIAKLPGRSEGHTAAIISKREAQVLGMLSQGSTTEQVAGELVLSPETVQTHVRNATRKLGAHGRLHAVILALVRGDIELPVGVR